MEEITVTLPVYTRELSSLSDRGGGVTALLPLSRSSESVENNITAADGVIVVTEVVIFFITFPDTSKSKHKGKKTNRKGGQEALPESILLRNPQ